jgi:type III pantothenate kinase
MNLVVDIGNTLTKKALFSNNEVTEYEKSSDIPDANWFENLMKNTNFDQGIVSSTRILDESLVKYLHAKKIRMLSSETPLPITLDYKTPETLGLDRIANAVGAHSIFPKNDCLVIDLGTCITYDFISKEGIYKGGAISPGLKMRYKAMNSFTDKLPLIEKPQFIDAFGRSTTESLNMGAFNGMAHEINGFIRFYMHKTNRLKIILTGGDTSLFEQHIENAIFAAPNLVLEGLNQVLLYNKQLNE